MLIKRFLSDLFAKPEDFFGNPYGYLTNQIGHVFLGGTVPMYVIGLVYVLTGKYPDQVPIVLNFVLAYAIAWEWSKQGWRGLDTVLDIAFVAMGASVYVFVEMDIVLGRMIGIYSVMYVLLLGSTFRVWYRAQ